MMNAQYYDFSIEIADILPMSAAEINFDQPPRKYKPDRVWYCDAQQIINELKGKHPLWFVSRFMVDTSFFPYQWEECRTAFAQALVEAEYFDQGQQAWRNFITQLANFRLIESQQILDKFKSNTDTKETVVSVDCIRPKERINFDLTRAGIVFWGNPTAGRQCAIGKQLDCGVWVDLSFSIGDDYRPPEVV
jgi:hypothetical protein